METDRYLNLRCGVDAKSLCHSIKLFSLVDLAEDINRLTLHTDRRMINDHSVLPEERLRRFLVPELVLR
jgi:hypothetical protein